MEFHQPRVTVAHVAMDLKSRIQSFCEKYDLPLNQKKYLINIYTNTKKKTASLITHDILRLLNKLPTEKTKSDLRNEIVSIFPNISRSTAKRQYKHPKHNREVHKYITMNKPLKDTRTKVSPPKYPILEEQLSFFFWLCQKNMGLFIVIYL